MVRPRFFRAPTDNAIPNIISQSALVLMHIPTASSCVQFVFVFECVCVCFFCVRLDSIESMQSPASVSIYVRLSHEFIDVNKP